MLIESWRVRTVNSFSDTEPFGLSLGLAAFFLPVKELSQPGMPVPSAALSFGRVAAAARGRARDAVDSGAGASSTLQLTMKRPWLLSVLITSFLLVAWRNPWTDSPLTLQAT